MSGWRHYSISLAASLCFLGTQAAASTEMADASVAWLEAEECPRFGYALNISGLSTPSQREDAINNAMEIAESTAQAIRDARAQRSSIMSEIQAKGRAPSSSVQRRLDALNDAMLDRVANAAVAMTQWTQAQWISLANTNPDFHFGVQKSHPLQPFIEARRELSKVSASFRSINAKQQWLPRISAKFNACLEVAQDAIVDHNAEVIKAETARRTIVSELQKLKRAYLPLAGQQRGRRSKGSEAIAAIDTRISELENARRQEREAQQRAVEAQREAARRARYAEMQAMLPIASTFVAGINANNINQAGSVLHPDVVISAPNQQGRTVTTHGKQQALQRLQQGFSSGNGGSTSAPSVNSNAQVTARVLTQKGRATMSFVFKDNKISRVTIQR